MIERFNSNNQINDIIDNVEITYSLYDAKNLINFATVTCDLPHVRELFKDIDLSSDDLKRKIKISVPRRFVTDASWYGKSDKFDGRITASGGVFNSNNPRKIAHQFLPMGTPLKVISAVTGRQVDVIVKDRGPCKPERGIDLPAAAATKLGIKTLGVSRVQAVIMPSRKR